MREVKLPSGAILKVNVAPFAASKALYQAVLKEAKGVAFNAKTDWAGALKDFFCVGYSSPEIERCLWECFKRCTYDNGRGDLKIDGDTFEPIEARDDYMTVCMEVAKDNITPFVKSLYAEFQHLLATIESYRA